MNTQAEVREIMTPSPITITATEGLGKIGEIFDTHAFHHLPVIRQGELVGIISRSDYLQISHLLLHDPAYSRSSGSQYENFSANDVMTATPMTISADDTVGLAADIFLANAFHALPVVEQGELVGIITSHDLLEFAYEQV